MAPSNQKMDQKNFVPLLGPLGDWEGLDTKTSFLAPILMPSVPRLIKKIKKKTHFHILPYPCIDKLWEIGGCDCIFLVQNS